jgi:excinuclease ABC subunit B
MRQVVRVHDRITQRELLQRLVAMQYKRNDADFSRGSFRVRGDTIDIFRRACGACVRVELFDDEIDSIQLFDP